MKKIVAGFIGIFMMIQFSVAVYGSSIDLVEMKKKEEERRKNLKKSKYKLNNTNINKIDIPKKKYSFMQVKPVAPPKKKADINGPPQIPPADLKIDPVKTRQYWQDLKNQLQKEIAFLNKKINNDQLRLNQLNTNLMIMGLPSRRANLKKEINKLSASLNQNKIRLTKLQEELEALFNRARKAGVPPGWLR